MQGESVEHNGVDPPAVPPRRKATAAASGLVPEALLRIARDGVCLEAIPFDGFDALPEPGDLLGQPIWTSFPRELTEPIRDWLERAQGRAPNQVLSTATHALRLQLSPSQDGTFWVRLQDVTTVGQVNEPPTRLDDQVQPLVEGDPDRALFHVDAKGRIVNWNAGAARLTGHDAGSIVGQHLSYLYLGSDAGADRVARAMAEATTSGSCELQGRLVRPNGSSLYSLVRITASRDADHALAGFWVLVRDITEQRRNDRRAATLYAVSRAVLDAATVEDVAVRSLRAICDALDWEVGILWFVRADPAVLECRTAVTTEGFPPVPWPTPRATATRGDGLAGRVWESGHADWASEGFREHPVFGTCSAVDQIRMSFAFPIRGGAGILGVMEFASRLDVPPDTELLRTAAIISHHIGQFFDRVHAETAVRQSEAQKAAILANALDGIITVDRDGRVLDFNAGAERTFGRWHTEMLGQDLAEPTIAAADRPRLRDALISLAASSEGDACGRRLEIQALRRDGQEFPADLSITRIRLEGPSRCTICVHDLSERKRLEEELHHAQKLESLGQLAGGIAHDFNNFLTVIRGQAERLVAHLDDGDERRSWGASILKVSDRAAALTRQLLAFGRRVTPTAEVVELNPLVGTTSTLLGQLLGESIQLDMILAEDLGRVRIDAGHVQQILFNLGVNARDAMSDAGRLEIGTENVMLEHDAARGLLIDTGPYVCLWVADSGRGMDARTQSRVFEPFFTTKTEGKGTGLGLSTVYGIVRGCAGQITVSSQLGRGSTFRIYLPRVEASVAATITAVAGAPLRQLVGRTMLVAEDQDEVREILRVAIEAQGGRVIAASGGPEALGMCAGHDGWLDLLVADVVMPSMNGQELARRCTQLRPDLKVLYISGCSEDELARLGVLTEGASLLRKPFASAQLVSRIRQVLDADASRPRIGL